MTDFDLMQQLAAQRRNQFAQQAQFQAPQGQMVGGHFVAPNVLQQLAAGLRSIGGMRGQQLAEQELQDISRQRTEGTQKAMADFLRQAQGTPENAPGDGVGPVMPAQAPNMQGAYSALLQAPDAGLRQAGMQGAISTAQQQAQLAQQQEAQRRKFQALQTLGPAEAVRQGIVTFQEAEGFVNADNLGLPIVARTAEILGPNGEKLIQAFDQRNQPVGQPIPAYMAPVQVNRGDRIEFVSPTHGQTFSVGMSPAERDASARGWVGVTQRQQEIDNPPERNVTVMDNQGNAITLPESQAVGMPRYTPQAAAQLRQTAQTAKARQQMTTTLNELKTYYDNLQKGGGIVSQNQGALGNLMARASASAPGQVAAGAVGRPNQILRDKIEQTRPLLLNLIKEATGMSAQQMNSNAEMQLYLRAATDPTLSYEANIQALDNLDKLFGLGLGLQGSNKDAGSVPASASAPRVLEYDNQGNLIR